MDILFLTPEGQLVGKLNSFKDFPEVHAGVSAPHGKESSVDAPKRSHVEVFLDYVSRHFGAQDHR